jgi:hypothetical protein
MFQFKHPFTCLVSGPTGCGKTFFIKRLISMKEYFIDKPIKDVIYCYNYPQDWFKNFPNVKFNQGFSEDMKDFIRERAGVSQDGILLVLDDLMEQASRSEVIASLFYEGSHHLNLSVLLVTQNLFYKSGHLRTISLNSHYIIIFKNPRETSVAYKLALQIDPSNAKAVDQIYKHATSNPYSYLCEDFKPDTHESLRYLTNVLLENAPYNIVFLIKSK